MCEGINEACWYFNESCTGFSVNLYITRVNVLVVNRCDNAFVNLIRRAFNVERMFSNLVCSE